MASLLCNGMNVGTELTAVSLSWNNNTVNVEQLGHLKALNQIRQENTKIIVTPVIYGGIRLHRNIYHDFQGSLMFARFNNNITNLIANMMANSQQTGAETYFSLYALALNTDAGGEDEMLYNQCVLDDHDAGTWGIAEVDQSFGFRCQKLTFPGAAANIYTNPPAFGAYQ